MTKIYQLVNANTDELIGLLEISNVCDSKEVETEVITPLLKEFSTNNNFDDFETVDDYFFELNYFIIKKQIATILVKGFILRIMKKFI